MGKGAWKRNFTTLIGGAIVGSLSFGVWPEMWKTYGIMGGFLTATFVIGISWYMNHWLGVIENPDGKLWVDQGLPIFGAGVAWGVVRFWPLDPSASGWSYCWGALAKIWPTLVCCIIGGSLAGVAAHIAKQVVPAWRDDTKA
ncbi:MAG: electron transporter RnfD [Kiritimatiellae bacterium]|nr:electron transporter RnfD [Kiritimatiellia bacterium]